MTQWKSCLNTPHDTKVSRIFAKATDLEPRKQKTDFYSLPCDD